MKESENHFFSLCTIVEEVRRIVKSVVEGQVAPPPCNWAPIALDDDSDDAQGGGRNKGMPDEKSRSREGPSKRGKRPPSLRR
jgi:hypothetical protein